MNILLLKLIVKQNKISPPKTSQSFEIFIFEYGNRLKVAEAVAAGDIPWQDHSAMEVLSCQTAYCE